MNRSIFSELTKQSITLCGDAGISICDPKYGPQVYRSDDTLALLEFRLSHAFPVETCDGTAIHPNVVANSFESMRNKVFNFGHLMRSYDPKRNPRDRILGSIIAVEFPPMPEGGWRLAHSREDAPGIRAIAGLFKAAEGVEDILHSYNWGKSWAVSMENFHHIADGGFLIEGGKGIPAGTVTPEDIALLGFSYVPHAHAPTGLLRCLNTAEDDRVDGYGGVRVKRDYMGQRTLFMVGGLNGVIHYSGTGLCQVGKEDEAVVTQMLASRRHDLNDFSDAALSDLLSPLHALTGVFDKVTVSSLNS